MNMETAKSFILVVMIGISIILSYTLWNYQPSSSQTIGGEVVENELDVGGAEKSKRNLIKPSDIIFHTDEGDYGFKNKTEQDRFFEKMQESVITDYAEYDSETSEIERSSENIEIIFPDELPMEVLNALFTFGRDDIEFPSWSLKRIFISYIHDSKSLQIEFISDEPDEHAAALITDAEIYEEFWSTLNELDENMLTEYLVINPDANPVYFPAGKIELPIYSITPKQIKPSLFVNILFTNPSVVRETRSQTIGEVYFTDNRQMSIFQDGMRMEYVSHVASTAEETDHILTEMNVLDRAILSINNHRGWTQDYRLESLSTDPNQVMFRMYYDGYPTFNRNKLATIEQRWEAQQNSVQLTEYNRPLHLFETTFVLRRDDNLPAGESILAYLEMNPDISLENIQDITIGYEMNHIREDQSNEFIEMSPSWYKKENNNWQRIMITDEAIPRGGN